MKLRCLLCSGWVFDQASNSTRVHEHHTFSSNDPPPHTHTHILIYNIINNIYIINIVLHLNTNASSFGAAGWMQLRSPPSSASSWQRLIQVYRWRSTHVLSYHSGGTSFCEIVRLTASLSSTLVFPKYPCFCFRVVNLQWFVCGWLTGYKMIQKCIYNSSSCTADQACVCVRMCEQTCVRLNRPQLPM